ncbi:MULTISPECIES: VanZ family protein [Bradyrhizobium]|jgi:VanZ family protein|uniref:VanZ family protein n=1 Tax=Bradyrhizobium TaxID=374 RepID=UPI000B01980B|nr:MULTISPECIES: VanZ family protein [Bradyrhizobium]
MNGLGVAVSRSCIASAESRPQHRGRLNPDQKLSMMARDTSNIARLAAAFAWIVIAVIAFATLTNIGFVYSLYYKLSPWLMHPDVKTYAHIEHVVAFAVLGALFALAYPRRPLLVCAIVTGAAAVLEFMQTLTPDRHGTLVDALEKMAGGLMGIVLIRSIVLACAAVRSGRCNQ